MIMIRVITLAPHMFSKRMSSLVIGRSANSQPLMEQTLIILGVVYQSLEMLPLSVHMGMMTIYMNLALRTYLKTTIQPVNGIIKRTSSQVDGTRQRNSLPPMEQAMIISVGVYLFLGM